MKHDAPRRLAGNPKRSHGHAPTRRWVPVEMSSEDRYLAAAVDDYEIACLETDRPAFYRRLGWEEWSGPLAGRSDQGLIPTPDQTGVMVLRLPASPRFDLDEQLTIEVNELRIW